MENRTFRGFIAISVPDEVRDFLASFSQEAAKHLTNCRFVDAKNLHLTLQFLGNDVSKSLIPDISEIIDGIAQITPPFDISLGNAGTFPAKGRPRVFYIGLSQGHDEVSALALNLQSRLVNLGFEKEESFHPHLTLARRKHSERSQVTGEVDERKLWQDIYADFRTEYTCETRRGIALSWTADKVALIESKLSSKGPVYSLLSEHLLGQKQGRRTFV